MTTIPTASPLVVSCPGSYHVSLRVSTQAAIAASLCKDTDLVTQVDRLLVDGGGFPGLADPRVASLSPRFDPLRSQLALWHSGHEPSFLGLPQSPHGRALAPEWKARIQDAADHLVVLGIGGSSLGGRMLVSALGPAEGKAGYFPVSFYDNIDPTTLARLETMDWRRTFLLTISKSGGTAEPLAQFTTLLPLLERHSGFRKRMAVLTQDCEGALGRIASAIKLPLIPHPPVGGRFSVLSCVGLIPAAVAGVSVEALLAGAARMAKRCAKPGMEENPALLMAAAQYLLAEEGRNISLTMTYGDRLRHVGHWHTQLWAESLGKRDRQGRRRGLTPHTAQGVTDQHSQLQLFLDGPRDKQYTFLYDIGLKGLGHVIPSRFAHLPEMAPLAGHTTGALFAAEFEGTRDTLLAKEEPVRTLALTGGREEPLGELIVLLESETVALATLFDVNPFNQPAVEESKLRARRMLNTAC